MLRLKLLEEEGGGEALGSKESGKGSEWRGVSEERGRRAERERGSRANFWTGEREWRQGTEVKRG